MAEPGGVKIELDYAAIGEFLRTDPAIRAYLTELGEKGTAYAKSIAPVGTRTTKYSQPGQYRDSIGYEVVEGRTRMSLRIYATDFTAFWVEYGSKHNTRHAVLRRTLDFLRYGGAKSASDYGGAEAYDTAHPESQRKRDARRRYRAARAAE